MKIDPALRKHLKKTLPVAKLAAVEAGEFLKRKFGKFRKLEKKPDSTLVTEADRGAEKIVMKHLKKKFPHDHFVGEESGRAESDKGSPFRWHIDPLDGTTNFVHGFPMFCVSIGLEFENSQLVLGVVHHPILGNTYTATKGGGAFRDGKRLRISGVEKLSEAMLSTGFSYRQDNFFETEVDSFVRIVHASRAIRRTGSAALDLTCVASGQFDGFWERNLASWDVAAGIVLLEEAGGRVTTLSQGPYRLGDESILATNGRIHTELAAAFGNSPR